ncbi:vascular endothelial growth factor C-like isoform X2 [Thalassophryne amazonica]|uniref:vascular endothelial growth factor C-like isoform X2 n=1 Tax=Thalassophryne amazonica TaxID=390379 RepID=UPI0014708B45|nr:vascular endothelial growth factor C-like isoform X2 [Thalassophryne amazonica]
MWRPALLLWILSVSNLCSGQDYMDFYQTGDMGSQAPEFSNDQPSLQTVTSVDQLLELLYPEYSLLQHCLQRKAWQDASSSSPLPPLHTNDDDLWAQLREEPLHKADGNFGVILEEIKRTACRPREVCVEVAKESTSELYLPRCVALHRCGGCCNSEASYCTNTSYTLVNKTLVEFTPSRTVNSIVMVTFVNHTSCDCMSKRPVHSIIRRAAVDDLCSPPDDSCLAGLLWDPVSCVCVPADTIDHAGAGADAEVQNPGLLALCGPNRVLDESTCECVCRNGLTQANCEPGWKLDHNTCECQCEGHGDGKQCPSGQRWDEELCGCVCDVDCPGNQPLNPDACLCQCRETPQSCLLQGKRFNQNTCSCYRLPCRKPRPVCQAGFYYSRQVCQCIPNYMRPEWN